MSNQTVLICGECGEGNYLPAPGDGFFKCTRCDHYMHETDFTLDAGERLDWSGVYLTVVHGGEQ